MGKSGFGFFALPFPGCGLSGPSSSAVFPPGWPKPTSPEKNWRNRPDMNPVWTSGYRASVVGWTRVVEDLVESQLAQGVSQYVILGGGLDTFAQRRADLSQKLRIFEIDKPAMQRWKKERLVDLGLRTPNLQFVAVNFEAGQSWKDQLHASGFIPTQPAIIASTGSRCI